MRVMTDIYLSYSRAQDVEVVFPISFGSTTPLQNGDGKSKLGNNAIRVLDLLPSTLLKAGLNGVLELTRIEPADG